MITKSDASVYWNVAKLVRDTIRGFLRETVNEVREFLEETLPAREGVGPENMMIEFLRYVRSSTHRGLYETAYYQDSLPDGGNLTIFRERDAKLDGR